MELLGQVAVITGGGQGIGRAIARALAGAGAAVTVTARTEDQLAETVALIQGAGGRALALTGDVTELTAMERVIAETERRLGPVDLLVNNAGINGPRGPSWELDPGECWRTVEVNFLGPLLCSQVVLKRMVIRRRGRIINLVSEVAFRPNPFAAIYSCSKAALVRLTDSVAAETKDYGISVFAIHPGIVRTEMTEWAWQFMESGGPLPPWTARIPGFPERSPLTPQDWTPSDRAGDLVVFLASGKADALSGRFIHVNYDLDQLVQLAAEIERDDLYVLRLRK